jgi:uncharacterized damage-inducible protein DinB
MPDYLAEFGRYRKLLDGALDQIGDEEFFAQLGESSNSVATILVHLGGNFRSRFTDFLTSDGEKPWRERDSEFEDSGLTREQVMERWQQGWQVMHDSVSALREHDMSASITIRGKPLSVEEALLRSVSHFAHHVGQVLLLGKYFRGADWRYLSIPPGRSEEYNKDPKLG